MSYREVDFKKIKKGDKIAEVFLLNGYKNIREVVFDRFHQVDNNLFICSNCRTWIIEAYFTMWIYSN